MIQTVGLFLYSWTSAADCTSPLPVNRCCGTWSITLMQKLNNKWDSRVCVFESVFAPRWKVPKVVGAATTTVLSVWLCFSPQIIQAGTKKLQYWSFERLISAGTTLWWRKTTHPCLWLWHLVTLLWSGSLSCRSCQRRPAARAQV